MGIGLSGISLETILTTKSATNRQTKIHDHGQLHVMKTIDYLKDGFQRIKEEIDIPEHHMYPIWAMIQLHHSGQINQVTVDEVYHHTQALLEEGGAGDSALDGFHYDDSLNELVLYQSKYQLDDEKTCSISDARELGNCLQLLYNEMDNDELPEARKEAAESLKNIIDNGGDIILRGISKNGWNKEHLKEVFALVPEDLKDITEVQLLGYEEILQIIAERSEDLANVKVEFGIYGNNHSTLHMAKGPTPGLGEARTSIVSAFSLADITEKHGSKLFDKNVRQHLGKGKRVNVAIRETLETKSGRHSFWYGHNGITILCDKIEEKLDGENKLIALDVTNPQIVNGCQTSNTIAQSVGSEKSRSEPKIDFGILARFIELHGSRDEKEEAANDIAYRTNNQQAVTPADLKSNDSSQKHISNILHDYGDRWFYIRKRGDWEKISKQPTRKNKYKESENEFRRIDREIYQQAWRCYVGNPAAAISGKGDVWTDPVLYKEVFNLSRRACDIVLVSVLFEWFGSVLTNKKGNALVLDIHKGLKNHLEKLSRARMRAAAHCLALFGMLVKEAYGSVDKYPKEHCDLIISKLKRGKYIEKNWTTSGQDKSWAVLEEAFVPIFKSLALYISAHVDPHTKTSNLTLYGALKDKASLGKMWPLLESDLSLTFKEVVTPK